MRNLAKLTINTETSFIESQLQNAGIENMPTLVLFHELQGDEGSSTAPEWYDMVVDTIEIANCSDYTAEQLKSINNIIDANYDEFSEEYFSELGENWNEYLHTYYGY